MHATLPVSDLLCLRSPIPTYKDRVHTPLILTLSSPIHSSKSTSKPSPKPFLVHPNMQIFATISTMLVALLAVAVAEPQWCTHGCVSRFSPMNEHNNGDAD